jgi:hypothetical protein
VRPNARCGARTGRSATSRLKFRMQAPATNYLRPRRKTPGPFSFHDTNTATRYPARHPGRHRALRIVCHVQDLWWLSYVYYPISMFSSGIVTAFQLLSQPLTLAYWKSKTGSCREFSPTTRTCLLRSAQA